MLHSVTNPLGEKIPLGKKKCMKEKIQPTDMYLATRCIIASLAPMTSQDRTHLLYISISLFCM